MKIMRLPYLKDAVIDLDKVITIRKYTTEKRNDKWEWTTYYQICIEMIRVNVTKNFTSKSERDEVFEQLVNDISNFAK